MEIFMNLLIMLGGVGIFLYGMKIMSSGIEQSAGGGIRNLFKKINKNRFVDYSVGVGTTVIMQSSSATAIMTIGLANAGIVNEKQGAGIILGAKVGTTMTAFIFALSGISKGSFSISAIFSAMAFVGVILLMTSKNDTNSKLGLFLTGFGMLFLGLEVMEFAIGGKDSILSQEITKLFRYEFMQNPILLLLLGIVFTCIIQSSSAATGIFIAFLKSGVLQSVDQSFFLIMGANIGTCMDGIMASFGSNIHGKRMALFHVLTSSIGAVVFSVLLIIFRRPVTNFFNSIFVQPEWSLATFNLAYNLIYTLILLAFINQLLAISRKFVKDKLDDIKKLKYIDERILVTPSFAIEQTLKEVYDMAVLARENFARAFQSVLNQDMSQSKKIAADEYQIDFVTSALAAFIIKVSSRTASFADEELLGGLHHVIADLERIGDHAVVFAQETNSMIQNDVHFIDETKTELENIFAKLDTMYEMCLNTFKTRKVQQLKDISGLQKEIGDMVAAAKNAHTLRLNAGLYSVEMSKSLYTVLLSLQRVADHLVNVAFSIKSNIGSKVEVFQKLENQEKADAAKKNRGKK